MYSGILVFNKPQGFTSHDVVAKLRGILRQKRIGHAGTLDPMATGVLVVLLGAATKASDDAAAQNKRYIAALRLGRTTDTRDIWGKTLTLSAKNVEIADLQRVLPQFRGKILQKPPMYSAVKIDGQKLYSLARKGVELDVPPREVEIHALVPAGRTDDGDFLLEIECSKGVYVRSLCHDIGEALGCGGCMSALERTKSGTFTQQSALSFDDVARLHAEGALAEKLTPTDSVYSQLAPLYLTPEGSARARHGAPLLREHLARGEMPACAGERVRVYTADGGFYMLGETKSPGGRTEIVCVRTFGG